MPALARILALAWLAAWLSAAPLTLDQVLDQVFAVRPFPEVAISPDGLHLAWVGQDAGGELAIHLLGWRDAGAKPRVLGPGRAIEWSPDSSRILFLSDREDNRQLQLYTAPARGGSPRRLTRFSGYLSEPHWSPDGRRIALLVSPGGGGGPLEATTAETGVIQAAISNARLTVVDAESERVHEVSPAGLNVYEFDWSPSGQQFALTAAPGPADDNWYIAQLYTLSLDSGKLHSLLRPSFQIAVPRWSPDGRNIAFIGGLMSDEGFTGGDLYTLPAAGGEARGRTPGRKSSLTWFTWRTPGKFLFTERVDGGNAISTLDLETGTAETLWRGDEEAHAAGNFPNFSLAADGRTAAIVRQSWQQPPEVWAGEIGRWRQITRANRDLRPLWGEASSVRWSNEGFRLQGWLLFPRDYSPSQRYPMVVSVHGGPAGEARVHWPNTAYDMSVLSAAGYFVFFPNPRGSYGQGEAFTRANVKDFGGGDLRDILAGVDYIVKTLPVDDARIGLTGWSYGGFMTMFGVTQTRRFRAAVAGAGIANWQSYYGQNSIDQWLIPYFGASVYDDPAVYAKSSPITFIKNVKTPTLVLVGERDGECPAPQSYEFWHALRTLGVPTQLVVYPGEGHMFRDPEHQRDVVRRAAEWFNRYLK
ncbi:MAG TPA: S9 family peptidase [Bryobacteraceae bacterium]|nr:S9 family peptidase [Bryobacteraceae bacterium]